MSFLDDLLKRDGSVNYSKKSLTKRQKKELIDAVKNNQQNKTNDFGEFVHIERKKR